MHGLKVEDIVPLYLSRSDAQDSLRIRVYIMCQLDNHSVLSLNLSQHESGNGLHLYVKNHMSQYRGLNACFVF
jgi:hypothetical protein